MSITLEIFYYIYLVFVLGFLGFTFFNVFHMLKFGFLNTATIVIVAFYLFVSVAMLSISWYYINQVEWTRQIPITVNLKTTF